MMEVQSYPFSHWVDPSLLNSRLDGGYNSRRAIDARQIVSTFPSNISLRKVSKRIVCGPFGSTLTAEEHSKTGSVVLVQPTDMTDGLFTSDPGWRISEQMLIKKKLPLFPAGSLLFARVGIYPHCSVLPATFTKATISSKIIAVVLNDKLADPYFYHAFFLSALGQTLLSGIQKMTGQPTIATEELGSIIVPFPELAIQCAIGNVMRKAERLKALAQDAQLKAGRLIESLVPLMPSVESKSKGSYLEKESLGTRLDAKYYRSGYLLARQLAQRLSGGAKIGDLAKDICNGVETRKFVVNGIPYLIAGSIDQGRLNVDQAPRIDRNEPIPAKALPQPGDLLVVRTGSIGQAVDLLPEDCSSGVVISSELIRIRLKDPTEAGFIAAFLNSALGKLLQEQITYGAVQPHISQEEIAEIPIPRVDEKIRSEVAGCTVRWRRCLKEMRVMINEAKKDAEDVIQGNLDRERLFSESREIEAWFKDAALSKNEGGVNEAL